MSCVFNPGSIRSYFLELITKYIINNIITMVINTKNKICAIDIATPASVVKPNRAAIIDKMKNNKANRNI